MDTTKKSKKSYHLALGMLLAVTASNGANAQSVNADSDLLKDFDLDSESSGYGNTHRLIVEIEKLKFDFVGTEIEKDILTDAQIKLIKMLERRSNETEKMMNSMNGAMNAARNSK